jgi:hypothetical protein
MVRWILAIYNVLELGVSSTKKDLHGDEPKEIIEYVRLLRNKLL